MTISGLRRRLSRLEVQRRPGDGLFFLAWGLNDDEIDQALVDADAVGRIARGDRVVRAVWPNQTPVPRCRWIKDEQGALSPEEFDVLADNLFARAEAGGWSPSSDRTHEPSEADQLSDVALIGLPLGVPWGGDAMVSK